MVNFLSSAALLAVLGGLTWLAFSRDPHWSSRDGRSFIARAHGLEPAPARKERWREVRGTVSDDGAVKLVPRGFGGRHLDGTWVLESRAPEAARGRAVFVLRGDGRIALRMPATSRAAAVLSERLQK